MELKSPPPCPNTAVTTVRRNPPRRARPTPLTNAPPARPTPSANPPPPNKSTPSTNPPPTPKPSSTVRGIPSFPIEDILSIVVPQNPEPNLSTPSSEAEISESLKVFLRIRPLKPVQNQGRCGKNGDQASRLRAKNVWPQNPAAKNTAIEKKKKKSKNKCEMCVTVIDSRSVTLSPPSALQDSKRVKTEVYEGFSHVFSPDSSQDEVYETMVNPLVEEFLNGKSGMLAALGPSGTGKTHTVFGSTREPGMVPLALRRIFKQTEGSELSRSFYISMLEIYSERGKGERLIDLCPENGDSCMPQSTIKGLREVMISDVAQAESLIARGMLKRATAMTNSNSQSSRSQCIIHIRCALEKFDEEVDVQANNAVLTIVDLAGAEREKRTGNQGARLLESNFINNTSMVFGSCLRSLLEHQKNPKKPLQKHFQNSLLTRYLRAYLEGKKRMSLILTVKPGEEDYLDTSFLLRQASPFMKIKFNNVEEPSTSLSNKRQHHSLHRTEKPKRIKFSGLDASVNEEARNKRIKPQLCEEEVVEKMINEVGANDMAQSPEGFKLTLGNGNEHQLCEEEVIAKKTKDVELVVKDLDQYPEDFTLIENIGNEHQLCEEEIIAEEAKEVEPAIDLAESPGNFTLIARNENEHELCKELIAQQIEEAGSVKDLPQSPEDCNLISSNGNENQHCEEVFIAKNMEEIEPVNDLGQFPEILKLIESNEDMCQLDEDEDIAKKIEEVEPMKDFAQSLTDSKLIASNGNEEQLQEGNIEKEIKEVEPMKDLAQPLESSKFIIDGGGHSSDCVDLAKRERTHLITQGFAKAIWSVLKEYKHKLKAAENEVHNLKENLKIEETRYSELEKEINELKSSCSCSCSGRISADTDSEPKDTNSGNKNNAEVSNVSVISSCHSLVIPSDASCSSDEKKLDLPLGVKENEALNEGCNIGNAPDVETKPLNAEKPKRRLLPASSVLLRDVSGINFVDENEKPKVNRAEKKFPAEEKTRTQGSISLLRMLTSNH